MHWMVCLVYFGPLHPDFYYGHIAFDKPSLESFLAGIKAHSARSNCRTVTGSGGCWRNDPRRDAEKHSSKCAQTRKGVH